MPAKASRAKVKAFVITREMHMQDLFVTLQKRLAKAEEIFFTWLTRIFCAAVLVGTSWIDDAPPLEFAAMIIALYVLLRILTEFGSLFSAAPFENRVLKALFALFSVILLGLSFLTIAIFADYVADFVVG